MARRTYTREFKLQAVRMLTDQGLSVAEAARRLGVGENCLRNWRAAAQQKGEAAFPGQGSPSPAEDELRRRVAATPELALGGVTFGWLAAALRSIKITQRPGYLEAIDTPILVCQAGADLIVSNRAQVSTVRRLPKGRLITFAGARHELLLERDEIRDLVLAAFREFTDEVMR